MISHYMRTFDLTFPAAVAMLDAEERSFLATAVCHVSSSHRLDDADALAHVRVHGAPQPGRMQ
jgi:hypothetical protein